MKIAFASDLHLKNNESWTLDVLKEILEKLNKQNIKYLFLGGDLFDSFEDLFSLKNTFVKIVEESEIEKLFFLPGNHDIKGKSLKDLENISFNLNSNKIILKSKLPFEYENFSDFEVIFIPFSKNTGDIYKSNLPEKRSKRIVIGHGSTLDFKFSNENEEENVYFDDGLFDYLEADIVLLGHIHKANNKGKINYIGSARVWRMGEDERHGFAILNTDNLSLEFIPLQNGGKFLSLKVKVENDSFELFDKISEFPKNTFLELKLEGIVSNDIEKNRIIEKLKNQFKNVLEISFEDKNIINIGELYNKKIYKEFIKRWKELYNNLVDEKEKEIYLIARKLFIEKLSEIMENN
jgi:predicted phosphodiesterase